MLDRWQAVFYAIAGRDNVQGRRDNLRQLTRV